MNMYIVEIVLGLLVALSIFTWIVVISKFTQDRKLTREDHSFSDQFWACKSWQEARQAVVDNKSEFGQIANAGFVVYDEYLSNPHSLRHAGEVNEILERPLYQKAQEILCQRERGLNGLASIGSLSPFIGLFGTVWGIMEALKAIGDSGQASIDVVAGPIGEALISTAIGIAVALPAVFFYNYFLRRLRLVSTNIDGFINDFLRLAVAQIKNSKN
jgi:biopolymer transport protein ExbB